MDQPGRSTGRDSRWELARPDRKQSHRDGPAFGYDLVQGEGVPIYRDHLAAADASIPRIAAPAPPIAIPPAIVPVAL